MINIKIEIRYFYEFMRLLNYIFFISVIFLTSSVNAKISQKDYVSIFTQYGVKDRNFIQPVINKCINELGKENLKVIKTNEGNILDHKKEKEFLDCTYSGLLNIIKPVQGLNSVPKKKIRRVLA